MKFDPPLRKKIRLKMPVGMLDSKGVSVVLDLLKNHTDILPNFGSSWSWEIKVNGKGEYVGMLPKRISKWYYKNHGIKLSSDILGDIGSIMSKYSDDKEVYVFDFTDKFDWRAGNFGDYDSCFWSCRHSALKNMESSGCLAIRFFNKNEGYARAWLKNVNEGLVVFNGYGLETLVIARILSVYLSLDYKKFEINNNGDYDYVIWINDAGKGYVLNETKNLNKLKEDSDEIDIKIDIEEKLCHNCCDTYHPSELIKIDGEFFCENCIKELYRQCIHCGKYVLRNSSYYSFVNRKCVCSKCLNKLYAVCVSCDKYHLKENCLRGLVRTDALKNNYRIDAKENGKIFSINSRGSRYMCEPCYQKNKSRKLVKA